MNVVPQMLSLLTVHHCASGCDFCCFSRRPGALVPPRIPAARLKALVDETADIASIGLIAFTGGECFALGLELDELVARATSLGKMTRCITNGYWALSPAKAQVRLNRLVAAGLKEIAFNTGTFYAKYVPLKRLKIGVVAAVNAGLRPLLNIEIEDDAAAMDELLKDPDLLRLAQEGKIIMMHNIHVEPASNPQLSNAAAGPSKQASTKPRVRPVMDVLTVTPGQTLVAFCGVHIEKILGLHLGSVADQTIREALAAAV